MFVCLFGFYGISTLVGNLMYQIHFYSNKQFYFKQFSLAYETVPFQAIQFSISTLHECQKKFYFKQFSSSHSRPGSDGNEEILNILQSSSITETSPSNCLVVGGRYILQPQSTGQQGYEVIIRIFHSFRDRSISIIMNQLSPIRNDIYVVNSISFQTFLYRHLKLS